VPILDSAERVGVLGTTLDRVSAVVVRQWALLGGLVGELVVTKSRYGDAPVMARRTEPVALAAEMRWALLPPLTFTSPDVVVSAILEPAYQVAGDAFDYAVNGDVAHVALFDAMGHGLEASRMANLAVGSYRHSRRRGEGLRACVGEMDAAIQEQFGDYRFVTGQVATLDLGSGVLSAINAGHPPPVVFHPDGTTEELQCTRVRPLGLGVAPSEPVETQLREGDVILFHTDGITEARSPAGQFFGSERLHGLVGELLTARLRPAEVLRRVVDAVLVYQPRLRDDATLLLLGWQLGEQSLPPALRLP
jgi:serine phosphatase RsbU (regulator of sigma subunit)